MNSVSWFATQPAGALAVTSTPWSLNVGWVVHGVADAVGSCERMGIVAASAAGFDGVWSTIRLEATRALSSKTSPFFCAYVVGVPTGLGSRKPALTGSAVRNLRDVTRGNCSSAAAKRSRAGNRLLQEPSTVRRPYGVRRSGI